MSQVRLNEATHKYSLNGRELPGVTNTLDLICSYNGVSAEVMKEASERGDIVHKACENIMWGILDYSKVPEDCRCYVEAFYKFMQNKKPKILYVEQLVYHEALRYAGKIDFIAEMYVNEGLTTLTEKRCLIDIKTTAKLMPTVGPQCASYKEAFNFGKQESEKVSRCFSLLLKKDGYYDLQECGTKEDFNIFISCLNVKRFMKKNKIKKM